MSSVGTRVSLPFSERFNEIFAILGVKWTRKPKEEDDVIEAILPEGWKVKLDDDHGFFGREFTLLNSKNDPIVTLCYERNIARKWVLTDHIGVLKLLKPIAKTP